LQVPLQEVSFFMHRPSRGRLAAVLSLTIAALFALTAVASAATLTRSGGDVTFTAAPGISNDVYLDQPDAAVATVVIDSNNDPFETAALPAGCTDTDGTVDDLATTATCTAVTRVIANTGDFSDSVAASQSDGGTFGLKTIPLTFNGGDDDDSVYGSAVGDSLNGEAGDDGILRGGHGDDTINGGDGFDDIAGGTGVDTLDGGAGDDDIWGGDGGDTINGGEGDDDLHGCHWDSACGGDESGADTINGDAGRDEIYGQEGNDVLNGGADEDRVDGGDGDDQVNGGAGDDDGVYGENGNDVVHGGDGDDGDDGIVSGGDGNDQVFGDAGNDYLEGGHGDDLVDGGAGDDYFNATGYHAFVGGEGSTTYTYRDPGNDTYVGGSGIDEIDYLNGGYDNGPNSGPRPVNVRISQDGVANDGQEGENDNVGSDIEDLDAYTWWGWNDTGRGIATITAGDSINSINTDGGDDLVTPGGGNDFVYTDYGNDTINAVDGFADRIDCGEGTWGDAPDNDVANVDQFDQVAANCETVNLTQVAGYSTENSPPTVAWVTPAADGGRLSNRANNLEVTASDDDGISQVVFLAGNRVICTDTVAPYQCTFNPTDEDVGKATLTAVAIDAAQQTATALRFVDLSRFALAKLTSKVSPKKDTSLPHKFKVSGKATLPAGVSADDGCSGKVQIRYKVGKKTISTRSTKLKSDCTYAKSNKFGESYRLTANKLRVFVTFQGNAVLKSKKAKTKSVKIG
jgi:Ca2+-binding RTX toxin-like protein